MKNSYLPTYESVAYDGRMAYAVGAARSDNPYLTRDGMGVLGEMWDRGFCSAADLSSLEIDAGVQAKRASMDAEHVAADADVAAAFPAQWAKAQAMPGAKRRELQRKLRRKYELAAI